jgi:hypothetical protein
LSFNFAPVKPHFLSYFVAKQFIKSVVAGIGDPAHGLIKTTCRRRVPGGLPAPLSGQAKDIIPENPNAMCRWPTGVETLRHRHCRSARRLASGFARPRRRR